MMVTCTMVFISRDENFGLVKQVQTAQTKLSILRLTKTFLTLSLADVAARVQLQGPEQAESYLRSMVRCFATHINSFLSSECKQMLENFKYAF